MLLQNLICLIWLYHLALSQTPPCDDTQKRTIVFIEGQIRNAHAAYRSTGQCEYYGYEDREFQYQPKEGHILSHHVICYDWLEVHNKFFVEATIKFDDLKKNSGTKMSDDAADDLKDFYHKCGCDEGGHIIPRSFGGKGYLANMFPQNANLNRGLWNKVCNEVSTFLLGAPAGLEDARVARMRFAFVYDDPINPGRPSLYYYSFTLEENESSFEVLGYFENEDHFGLELEHCWDGKKKYIYVQPTEEKYFSRRSCKADKYPSTRYGPILPP